MFIFNKNWSRFNTIYETAITQSLLKTTLLTLVNMTMEILFGDLFAAIRRISLLMGKNIKKSVKVDFVYLLILIDSIENSFLMFLMTLFLTFFRLEMNIFKNIPFFYDHMYHFHVQNIFLFVCYLKHQLFSCSLSHLISSVIQFK